MEDKFEASSILASKQKTMASCLYNVIKDEKRSKQTEQSIITANSI